MHLKNLKKGILTAQKSQAYKNYKYAKKHIIRLAEKDSDKDSPSDYWNEELAGFSYMLDASPLIINRLREHCYHVTGLSAYDYREHHCIKAKRIHKKFELLQAIDKAKLFIPESPKLGGFGYRINGDLINIDTLKFYESMIALDQYGMLNRFKNCAGTVIEIGAGWGGFAYQFKKLFPNTKYYIVDLPQTMIFSIVYLMTLFPECKIHIVKDINKFSHRQSNNNYDFIFIPHYLWEKTILSDIDLAINIVSFQEMTSRQVESYIKRLKNMNCKNIYSHNKDCSPYNTELSNVSELLKDYYYVDELKILNLQYNCFSIEQQKKQSNGLIYKHLLGRL